MDKIEPSCACPSMCRKSVEFALWIFQLVSCDYFHNYTVHLFRTLVKEQSFIRRIIIMGSPDRHVLLFDICLRRLQWWTTLDIPSQSKWPSRLTGGKSNHHKRLASRKIWSVEELDIQFVGTKPWSSHQRSLGRVRRRKNKRSTTLFEKTRKGHRQAEQHRKSTIGILPRDGVESIWVFPGS